MSKQNVYELILDTYKQNKDEGRILLYNSMGRLMRKNPLMRIKNHTYETVDLLSEAFLMADEIIQQDTPEYKKVARLWYLFNKGGGALYNKINQYSMETYNIDEGIEGEDITTYISDDILDWILVKNNIITPIEEKVLSYLKEGRGKYEIARQMNTSYYNVKSIVETLTLKIKRFLDENDIDATYG